MERSNKPDTQATVRALLADAAAERARARIDANATTSDAAARVTTPVAPTPDARRNRRR